MEVGVRLVSFPPSARLVLVRHGQSRKNLAAGPFYKDEQERERLICFHDRLTPLTDKGRLQARKAGRGLKKLFRRVDRIYHSGYDRARDTVKEIQSVFRPHQRVTPESVIESHLIRERNPGYLTDFTDKEVRNIFPWWNMHWYYSDPFTLVPIGGESIASMCEGRILFFLRELSDHVASVVKLHKESEDYDESEDFNILIVSHGRAIQCMRYLLEDWSYDQIIYDLKNNTPKNCAVTSYIFDYGGRAVLEFENKVF